jgi:hypothetical protein
VAETRQRLKGLIDLEFEKVSVDNALNYTAEVTRLKFVIDPDIAAAGVDLTTRVVDLKVKRVSIESVLGLILGADLGYKVEAGYILITTREKLQQKLPVVTPSVAAGAAVNEVRAKKFVLVDDTGKTRAVLDVDKSEPGLTLLDAAGKPRAGLRVSAAGPSLDLYDAAGKPRAGLFVVAGGPVLTLADAAGKWRASLGVLAGGSSLDLYDAAGKPRAGLFVLAGEPGLTLYDAAGKMTWRTP